jgi:hypothetical protein
LLHCRAGYVARVSEKRLSPEPDEELVRSRAELLDEEREAGSDDPIAQARAILEDSEVRTLDREAAPGTTLEQRTSDSTVEPVDDRPQ